MTSSTNHLSINKINEYSDCEFVKVFGNAIEHCAEAARTVKQEGPFASTDDLINRFSIYLNGLDEIAKINILRKHPDLARKEGTEGLTEESKTEQACTGITTMAGEANDIFQNLKKEYSNKFQFPFIICARENSIATIIDSIQSRIGNSPGIEINVALQEVNKICKLRLNDILRGAIN